MPNDEVCKLPYIWHALQHEHIQTTPLEQNTAVMHTTQHHVSTW
jgi:hypothetical protein